MKRPSKLCLRIFITAIGLSLVGAGCSLGIRSGLGVDPASVFELGLGGLFHVSYGTAVTLTNLVILAAVFLIDRHYISIATAMALFLVGASADAANALLELMLGAQRLALPAQAGLMLAGCLVMSVGIAVYIRAGLGVGAMDLASEIITGKTGLPYRWVRMGGDLCFVIAGVLLGGVAGVGTLVTALLVGPMVSLVRPMIHRLLDPLLAAKEPAPRRGAEAPCIEHP